MVILKRDSNIKYLPHAFTEHGAIMAATVLNSPRAVQMTVFVVRAFVRMRADSRGPTTRSGSSMNWRGSTTGAARAVAR